jgi:cold shock CspA family protein
LASNQARGQVMPTGEITQIIRSRGVGFLRETNKVDDILFYLEAVPLGSRGRLAEGQKVEFDRAVPNAGNDGRNGAVNVRLLKLPWAPM